MTQATHSRLYTGRVWHTRRLPKANAFHYGTSYLYLDLDELTSVMECWPLASTRRPAIARFVRRDYLRGPAGVPPG